MAWAAAPAPQAPPPEARSPRAPPRAPRGRSGAVWACPGSHLAPSSDSHRGPVPLSWRVRAVRGFGKGPGRPKTPPRPRRSPRRGSQGEAAHAVLLAGRGCCPAGLAPRRRPPPGSRVRWGDQGQPSGAIVAPPCPTGSSPGRPVVSRPPLHVSDALAAGAPSAHTPPGRSARQGQGRARRVARLSRAGPAVGAGAATPRRPGPAHACPPSGQSLVDDFNVFPPIFPF